MANQGPSCGHIIKVLDWQDHLDQYIMVLERPLPCMDTHSFWQHNRGRFIEKLARHFMRQVIYAAALCCSRGVLHRDIKMENLLVNTETLEVKLIDFGCGDLMKISSYKNYSGMCYYLKHTFWDLNSSDQLHHVSDITQWDINNTLTKLSKNSQY